MKKAIALLLTLMLVFTFALVACGDEATDTGDDAVAAGDADDMAGGEDMNGDDMAGGAIDWSEASDYETQEATITGEVGGISNLYEEKGIAKAMVHLGGPKAEDHFNVTFVLNQDGTWPDYLSDMEAQFSDDLIGKTMEVTGTISLNSFESVFEILINDADNNTLPDDAASATWVIK